MVNDDVRRLLNSKPFQPFLIQLVDGTTFEIHHPEFVWFPEKNQRVMHITDGDGRETIVNTTIVVSMQRFDPDALKKHLAKIRSKH